MVVISDNTGALNFVEGYVVQITSGETVTLNCNLTPVTVNFDF